MWHLCGPPSWRFIVVSTAALTAARADPGLESSRLVDAVCHPDTGEPIPPPFRMASHVPVNALLLALMLSARSVPAVMFTQAVNQSFNAAQFYANRNGSNAVSDTTLAVSFTAAVVSAVSVGALAARNAERAVAAAAARGDAVRGARARAAVACVPFLGAAAGKPLQISAMRSDEFAGEGVVVTDAAGTAVGRSRIAGAAAVNATIFTRILYLAPMLWMPHVQLLLERALLPPSAPPASRAALLVVHAAVNSAVATPACIALFEQRASLPASALEERFWGRGGEELYFNKGL